jgi:hypothetical protein
MTDPIPSRQSGGEQSGQLDARVQGLPCRGLIPVAATQEAEAAVVSQFGCRGVIQIGSSRRTVATRSIARSNEAITPTPVRSALATR